MDKDTVILDLKTYNQLRDYKTTIESDNVIKISYSYGYSSYIILDKTELIDEIIKTNEDLKSDYDNLSIRKSKELKECDDKISALKKMSIFEFLRWRRK